MPGKRRGPRATSARGGGADKHSLALHAPPCGGASTVTPSHRAFALRPPAGGAARALRSIPPHSAPAPLAKALCDGVPLRTPKHRCSGVLSARLGSHAVGSSPGCTSPAPADRRPFGVAAHGIAVCDDLIQGSPTVLLALQARCGWEGLHPSPSAYPHPTCGHRALRALAAIRSFVAWVRGGNCPPFQTPSAAGCAPAALRRACPCGATTASPRAHAHAALAVILRASVRPARARRTLRGPLLSGPLRACEERGASGRGNEPRNENRRPRTEAACRHRPRPSPLQAVPRDDHTSRVTVRQILAGARGARPPAGAAGTAR